MEGQDKSRKSRLNEQGPKSHVYPMDYTWLKPLIDYCRLYPRFVCYFTHSLPKAGTLVKQHS